MRMPLSLWQKRPESLGVFVVDEIPASVHRALGDRWHRIAVRNAGTPLLVTASVHVPLRVVVAHLLLQGRVACYVTDRDDVPPWVRRLHLLGHDAVRTLPYALCDRGTWSSHVCEEHLPIL